MRVKNTLLVLFVFIIGCSQPPPDPLSLPDINGPGSAMVIRGEQLVNGLAACGFCHSAQPKPYLTLEGGSGLVLNDTFGEVTAGNISPSDSGIGSWNIAEIISTLREGRTPEKRRLSKAAHGGFEWLSDSDALSISVYLKTITPSGNETLPREVSFYKKYTLGLFNKTIVQKGVVPDIAEDDPIAFGRYLTENVARCQSCHNTPSTFFNKEEYLKGGGEVTRNGVTKLSPDISETKLYGLGDWRVEEIVYYLGTGITKDGRKVSSEHCPTEFYARASMKEKELIAKYIKTLGGN